MGETIDNKQEDTPSHIAHAVIDFVKPARSQLLYYFIASMVLTFASRLTWALQAVGIEESSLQYAKDTWANTTANIQEFSDISSTAGTAVLWFVIGSIIYLLFWGATVAIIDGYNDIVVSSRFLHPRSFHRADYWTAIAGRIFVRVSGSIFLIALTMWSLSRLIVARFNDAYNAWSASSPITVSYELLRTIVLSMLLMHAFTVCLRLAFLRRRLF